MQKVPYSAPAEFQWRTTSSLKKAKGIDGDGLNVPIVKPIAGTQTVLIQG